MAPYVAGRPLPVTREALGGAYPQPTARLCVLLHGLACNEGVWAFPDPDRPGELTSYGAALHAEFGYTPIYLRYNTGRSIAHNGRDLVALLTALVDAYPLPVDELLLIGHSMGGLVIRYACHLGAAGGAAWVPLVRRAFYLGSPHEGAPLAMLAHTAAAVLTAVPNPITRLIGDIFNLRSQGVKELRTAPHHADDAGARTALSWLPSADHYLVFGTLTEDPEHLVALLLGDGLVLAPDISDGPHHPDAPFPIPREHVACFPRTDHMQLAHDPAVCRRICRWCAGGERSD
jgi:triacylglycerol lipase